MLNSTVTFYLIVVGFTLIKISNPINPSTESTSRRSSTETLLLTHFYSINPPRVIYLSPHPLYYCLPFRRLYNSIVSVRGWLRIRTSPLRTVYHIRVRNLNRFIPGFFNHINIRLWTVSDEFQKGITEDDRVSVRMSNPPPRPETFRPHVFYRSLKFGILVWWV